MPGGGGRKLIDISFKFRSQMALCAILDGDISQKLFTYVLFSEKDEMSCHRHEGGNEFHHLDVSVQLLFLLWPDLPVQEGRGIK